MHVHFASGNHPFSPPWLNVDYDNNADIVADLLEELPVQLTGIRTAYVGHFLEHLYPGEAEQFLQRIRHRTAPDGQLVIIGPDVEKGRAAHHAGTIDAAMLHAIGAHGQYEGHARSHVHLWNCTAQRVVTLVQLAGWRNTQEHPLKELTQLYPHIPMIAADSWQFLVTADA